MLFGVPDEIKDVTRVSGLTLKIDIYDGFIWSPESFGQFRQCTGSDEWVLGVHREGPTHLGVSLRP